MPYRIIIGQPSYRRVSKRRREIIIGGFRWVRRARRFVANPRGLTSSVTSASNSYIIETTRLGTGHCILDIFFNILGINYECNGTSSLGCTLNNLFLFRVYLPRSQTEREEEWGLRSRKRLSSTEQYKLTLHIPTSTCLYKILRWRESPFKFLLP